MTHHNPEETSILDLIERFDAILFDAYGVLVRSNGAIHGAKELIIHLNDISYPYMVITNDASRSIKTATAHYQQLGLPIDQSRVITSSSLLLSFVKQHNLAGKPVVALGEGNALDYIKESGATLVDPATSKTIEAVFLCELTSATLHQDLEDIVSAIIRHVDTHHALPHLVLPNPDLIYPKTEDSFGITAGSIAAMIQTILEQRYPSLEPSFEILGKPAPMIFEEGLQRLGIKDPSSAVMIGDQLATDIQGARQANLYAALVQTGLHTTIQFEKSSFAPPHFILKNLALSM